MDSLVVSVIGAVAIVVASYPFIVSLKKMGWKPRVPERKNYLNVDRENYKLYIEDLAKAEKNLILVFGEIDDRLYKEVRDNPIRPGLLYKEMKDALSRGVIIEIICGSEIIVDDEFEVNVSYCQKDDYIPNKDELCNWSRLMKLVLDGVPLKNEENYFNKPSLYFSEKRINNHFRLRDDRHVYIEEYHRPASPTKNCWVIENSVFMRHLLIKDYYKHLEKSTKCSTQEEIVSNFKFITLESVKMRERRREGTSAK